jgi:hypothetical protein
MSKRSTARLGATDSTVRPGEYPLGSAVSRAAARALAEARKALAGEGTLIRVRLVGGPEDSDKKCTCMTPEAGTFMVCRCFL